MAKKTAKTSAPAIVGRFAKLDRDWTVAFPSDVAIAKGAVVTVVTAAGEEKKVKISSTGVVLFNIANESVSGEVFYTFDRIAK